MTDANNPSASDSGNGDDAQARFERPEPSQFIDEESEDLPFSMTPRQANEPAPPPTPAEEEAAVQEEIDRLEDLDWGRHQSTPDPKY